MTFLFVVIAIVIIAVVALAITGKFAPFTGLENSGDHVPERNLAGEPTFDVTLRGYRMDEVDQKIQEMQGIIDALKADKLSG